MDKDPNEVNPELQHRFFDADGKAADEYVVGLERKLRDITERSDFQQNEIASLTDKLPFMQNTKEGYMKVFLGGTCNESTWRSRLIEMLSVDYFDPVVDDWTEEAQKRELKERKTCAICLYCITPLMTGVYSIAEVVDDSNKQPGSTVFVILRDDDGERFSKGQWKSLCAVGQMVKRNGGYVFDNLRDAAVFVNGQDSKEA